MTVGDVLAGRAGVVVRVVGTVFIRVGVETGSVSAGVGTRVVGMSAMNVMVFGPVVISGSVALYMERILFRSWDAVNV